MRLLMIALSFAVSFPSAAMAELTLEKLQSMRAEAQAFVQPAEQDASQANEARAVGEIVDLGLEQMAPEDFPQELREDAFAWRDACAQNDWDSCLTLGELFVTRPDVLQDADFALALAWLGCRDGHGASCHTYDRWKLESYSSELSYPAQSFHETSCAQGDALSCHALWQVFMGPDPALAQDYGRIGCALDPDLSLCQHLRSPEERAAEYKARRDKAQAECDAGSGLGCYNLARFFSSGETAFAHHSRGCSLGHAPSCKRAGGIVTHGRRITIDPVAGREFYKRACDISPKECFDFAHALETGLGGPAEPEKARALHEKSCAASDNKGKSCTWLANQSFDPFSTALETLVREDALETARAMQAQCRANDADACYQLATMMRKQRGPKTTEHHWRKTFSAACEMNHVRACFEIAPAHYTPNTGHGWDRACDARIGEACVNIALTSSAEDWLDKLDVYCRDGIGAACTRLGQWHEMSEGRKNGENGDTKPDKARALPLFEQACALGDGQGCAFAGWIIDPEINRNEPQDRKHSHDEARAYYDKGCERGSNWGCTSSIYASDDSETRLHYAEKACALGDCSDLQRVKLQIEHEAWMDGRTPLYAATTPHLDVFVPKYQGVARRLGRACAADHAWSCYTLGYMYSGWGEGYELVKQSFYTKTGLGLMKIACDLEYDRACEQYLDHRDGETPEQTAIRHAALLAKCEEGRQWACSDLYYETDKADTEARVYLLKQRFILGEKYAGLDLSFEAAKLPAPETEAIWGMLCAWGQPSSCIRLAEERLKGRRALKKQVLTYSCEDGERDACRMLKRL